MAAPVYTTDLTTFWLEGATTVTAIGAGGAGLGNPETDFFIQGTDCISKAAWTNNVKGFIIDALATTFTVPTDGAVIGFAKYDAQGSLDTQALGGFRMIIGSGSGDYYEYYCAGSDTIAFDSWIPYVIDPNTATADVTTGTPTGSERWVGILADLPTTSGPTKGSPIGMDAIRYGRCRIDYTVGDVTTPATFDGAETTGNVNGTRWGLLELQKGAYQTQGFHSIGVSATAVYFSDSNKVLFWRKQLNNLTNDSISTGFNRVEVINSGSTCIWDNIIWSALGTRSRGLFVHTAGTVTLTNCQFFDWNTFTFLSTTTATDCTFSRCNAVTAPGTTLNGSKVLTSTVAADTGGLVYDSATNTDGKLDNMTFSKGTNAHHAIDFGTAVTGNIILRNCAFNGFGSTDDSNDSTVRFLATTGSLTLSLIGCTVDGAAATSSNFSVDDAAGIAVTLSISPVTTLVHVNDNNGDDLVGANVYLRATDGTGDLPFEESVTISRATTVATVTHTAHGLNSNEYVKIDGITDKTEDNSGAHQITLDGVDPANKYTYTTTNSGSTSYTGTIISTGVMLYGLTDINGDISSSRTYALDQPLTGFARKADASPIFKTFPLDGTVLSSAGLTISIRMILDE